MHTISLCMIVKNEENYLKQCLDSISDLVDEIILVDTGSTDRTMEIAKEYDANIYEYEWTNSFSEARNVSLQYATKEFILILDADDEFCNEDKEKFLTIKKDGMNSSELYYFQTLNYCGEEKDVNNISINPNPRLFSNHAGFIYEGTVHNQLVNHEQTISHVYHDIRIYHYGYLNSVIKDKKKRERNMSLLLKQIELNPDNKFAHFNLGNEYSALDDYENALIHYEISYKDMNPKVSYGYYLIIRLLIIHLNKKQYLEALKFANEGLLRYPESTDFHYYYAEISHKLGRITIAIAELKKCIELGESAKGNKFVYGTGSFKAAYELGCIYEELKDFNAAYQSYNEALKMQNSFIQAAYGLTHILSIQKASRDTFKSVIEKLFHLSSFPEFNMAKICYKEHYYEDALDYLDQYEKNGVTADSMAIRMLTYVRMGRFQEVLSMPIANEDSPQYVLMNLNRIIAAVVLQKYEDAGLMITQLKHKKLGESDLKTVAVYEQFIHLTAGNETVVLSEDTFDHSYTEPIFAILEVLLDSGQTDLFFQCLNLLNLISDTNVLLMLGKLYHAYGYDDMAKTEILHSIKEFEQYDAESLDLLKVT